MYNLFQEYRNWLLFTFEKKLNFMRSRSYILRFFCILHLFLVSCVSRYSSEVEQTLRFAGGNRSELTKVLRHYATNPADSLKLRAAEFLIANMPGKYSRYYDAPWNDVAAAMLRWTSSPDKQRMIETYQLGEPVIEEDAKHITADFLIENIELAFKVWQERPWGKYIPFEAFCEDILPYRIGAEPLENWREKVLASFAGLEAELNKPGMTAVEACTIVNEILPDFKLDSDFPDMNYSQSMASTRGSCDKMANFTVYVMRGLGIPVTVDHVLVYTGRAVGHVWNAVRDSVGNYVSFMGTETSPGQSHQGIEVLQSKIYRRTFAIQRDILQISIEQRPPMLKHINNIDVSSCYEGFFDIRIPIAAAPPNDSKCVYLAVIGGDVLSRHIIARGSVESGFGVFQAIGINTGYYPVYYADGRSISAGAPFRLDSLGRILPIAPNGSFKGPHILSAHNICIIPLRDFDIGGEGVAFHETTSHNRGLDDPFWYRFYEGNDPFSIQVDIEMPQLNLCFIDVDEWLNYTVEVEDAGTYLFQLSASGALLNGKFHIEVDGKNVTGSIDVPANGELFDWEWLPKAPARIELSKGCHTIRFYCEQTDFNAKELKFIFLKR